MQGDFQIFISVTLRTLITLNVKWVPRFTEQLRATASVSWRLEACNFTKSEWFTGIIQRFYLNFKELATNFFKFSEHLFSRAAINGYF